MDLRYQGQAYFLNVPWQDKASAGEKFQQRHQQLYGHRLALPLELVNVRVSVSSRPHPVSLSASQRPTSSTTHNSVILHDIDIPVSIIPRDALQAGEDIHGPALITETVSTTYVAAGWRCSMTEEQTLLLNKNQPTK